MSCFDGVFVIIASVVGSSPAFWVDLMRLVEEVYVKAKEDLICQSCGIDIPKDSNHLLESYVHHGVISTSHYCLNPKCNPPNNVRLKLFWGSIAIGFSLWLIYFFYKNAGF